MTNLVVRKPFVKDLILEKDLLQMLPRHPMLLRLPQFNPRDWGGFRITIIYHGLQKHILNSTTIC